MMTITIDVLAAVAFTMKIGWIIRCNDGFDIGDYCWAVHVYFVTRVPPGSKHRWDNAVQCGARDCVVSLLDLRERLERTYGVEGNPPRSRSSIILVESSRQ